MKNFPLLLFIFFIPVLSNAQAVLVNGKPIDEYCADINVTSIPDSIKRNNYNIEKVEINDDCLFIFVGYGCGCGTSDFSLHQYNIINKLKPEIHYSLSNKTNNICKALCHEKLAFDISEILRFLKNKNDLIYIDGYQSVSISK
ncbi:MAG TPA: hypothetical protein VD908_07270 [Cytophagales bacterium]|nr:hypothetical protein [Cytophagales bacterium]